MKENGAATVLIVIVIVLLLSIAGVLLEKTLLNNSQQVDEKKLDVGENHVKTRGEKYRLPSGGEIAGIDPWIQFDDYYLLNTVSKPNYLSLSKKLVTYHHGYKYDITNNGCLYKRISDDTGGYNQTTECDLTVLISKDPPPSTKLKNYEKKLQIVEDGKNINGLQSIESEPLLYISASATRIQKNDTYQIYNPRDGWTVYLLTNYGYDDITFSLDELINKQTKTLQMGPQKIEISIDKLSCNKINYPDPNTPCSYFTEMDFTVKLLNEEIPDTEPIRIQTYDLELSNSRGVLE